MNRTLTILLGVAASGWLAWSGWRMHESPRPSAADCDHSWTSRRLTANGDPSATEANDEDNLLLKTIADQGALLIEQGKTVDAQILIKQLEFDKCELELPELVANGKDAGGKDAGGKDPGAMVETAKEGVVVVAALYKCPRCDNWHASPASGFVLSADGAIVTSHHVINEADKKTFVVMTANRHLYPVTRVLAASRADDLAIVKVDAEGLKPLAIGTPPAVGAPIGVLSHPAAHFYSYSSGIVSRSMKVRVTGELVDALQITADFARGSSGAPVINAQGQVVGIVRSTESVYANTDAGQQKDLQMVFKLCVPAKSLRKLIRS